MASKMAVCTPMVEEPKWEGLEDESVVPIVMELKQRESAQMIEYLVYRSKGV